MTGAILTYYLLYKLFSTKGLQMEAVHKSLGTTLLLGTLMASMVPTQLMSTAKAEDIVGAVEKATFWTPAKKLWVARIAIAVSATAILFLSSENARTLTCKAYYKSLIAALRLLQSCPLPASAHEKLANKIEQLEALYTTRTGESFTSENLRAMLKEFKDLWDVIKAGKELCALVKTPALEASK